MSSYSKKFIALDLETTHLDMKEGRIMEAGAVEAELSFDQKEKKIKVHFGKSFSSLVNPEIEPSASALSLTGIALEELKTAPVWKDVKTDLQKFFGNESILGQNILFDLEYLKNQGLVLKNQHVDTLELALTFLPLLPAHSLEYLAEEFGIEEGLSHRALTDAKNSGLVLAGILNEFLSFDLELQKEIREYLVKSNLKFRDLILDLSAPASISSGVRGRKRGDVHYSPPPSLTFPPKADPPLAERGEELFNSLSNIWPDKTIMTLPLSFSKHQELLAFLALQNGPKIVGVSHPTDLDLVPQNQQVVDPKNALCAVRYERIKGAEKQQDEIWKILIKLAILREFEPGSTDLSQIKWAYEERAFLHLLRVDPQICSRHHCIYFQSLEFNKKQTYFLTLSSLFTLVSDWQVGFSEFPVLLFDLAKIEDGLAETLTESWDLRKIRNAIEIVYARFPQEAERVANELDLFFGILHLVYLKSQGEFAESLVVDDTEKEQERFQKLFHPAQKLISKLETFAEYLLGQEDFLNAESALEEGALRHKIVSLKNLIYEIFLEGQPDKYYWLRFGSKFVALNAMPKKLEKVWQEFIKKFASTTIIDTQLPQSSISYFDKILGISSFRFEQVNVGVPFQKIAVKIFSKNFTTEGFQKLLSTLPGSTIVILPSKAKLSEVSDILRRNPSPNNRIITSRRLKNVDSDFTLLLSTNETLRHFKHYPEARNLVIWRLPFEAPGVKTSFIDYVLPRTVHIFHTLLARFLAGSVESKSIYILDPRVLTEYDQVFIKYLQEVPDFVLSTGELD
ncbi:MAG: hypothetical protein HY396_01135 [Candidatus Doudnabacteria bacterium]|nr:hypothetical protein [Candidatus Doudnabacteria bacterium]